MDRMTEAPEGTPATEITAEAWRAWEAKQIAAARASAAVGRVVTLEAVEAWVDSWGTGHELPQPRSGR